MINGEVLDPSLYSITNSTLTLDFTTNTDPIYGLTDEDSDGFFNDLQGGQSVVISTSIAIGCSDSMGACSGSLACSLSRIEVNGKRNCGQGFQQFANLSEPVNFFYGNDGTSTNAVQTTGYGLPITEVVFTTCDVWSPADEGHEFHYDFNSNNIGHCEMSGGIRMEVYVQANGARITDIRYEQGSATYQGAAVPGTTSMYDTVTLENGDLDTIGLIISIPAGDPTVTAHDYYFNLEYRGDCYPNDYHFTSFKVIEECLSCTEVSPCEIVRACDSHATYVDWNGCGCVCDIFASVDTLQRCNFGYADKAMTQKLTAADVPTEDLIRFLPGDTMYYRLAFEVLNSSVFYEGNYRWLFDVRYYTWEAALMPDVYNANFLGWFHEDVSAGTGPIEIGIPDCMQAYDDANRDNTSFPSMRLENFGVEGTLADGGECPDDDENPNYPGSSVAAYRMADLSAADYVNDLSRLDIFFGRDPGCASATPDEINNGCHAALLEQLDLEDGDFFYIDVKVPMVRNPNVSLADLNGVTPSTGSYLYPYAMTYQNATGTCSAGANARTCRTTGQYEGHLPGPITITQDVCVTDCNTEVEYTFNLTNDLPTVDAGVTPWYENEYRPFMATDYLEVSFPSNMVYLDNGVIVMPDGSEVPFSPFIDTNEGNLNCLTGPGGEQCCIAADPSQLAMMKIIDNDYTIGQSQPYYRGPIAANNTNNHCDVYQLLHVPNDPFPHIPVGGPGDPCSYGLKYSLSALCPEDIESGDFQLEYQFSDPYVPSLPGSGGVYNSYHRYSSGTQYPASNGFRYPINPYGTGCDIYPNATYTWPYGCQQFYESIVSNPDDSPGSINPMRQTGILVTGPDNFADKSLNYPPLAATMQKTLIADEAMMNEENTYTVCADNNGIDMGVHMNVVTTLQIPTTIDLIGICDDMGTPLTFDLVQQTTNNNLYSVINPDLAPGECFQIVIKTELLFCPVGLPDVDVEICVTTVSGCIDPSKAALFTALGETQCDSAGACYEYIAEEAEMQAEWSTDATGEYPLCETFDMAVRIKNVRPTILTDIEPEWYFPAGLNFVPGTWQVCFPGGPANNGAAMSIADPIADPSKNNIYGTYFEFIDDADWSTYIDQNGLPGVASMLDSNKVEFKFEVETDCNDFVSGTSIWFRADGADPCEMRTGSGFVPTSPIIIDGANPSDFAQFFVFADPLDATCGEASTITMNFLNISPTGTTDNSMVCMDIDTETFSYMMGSIQWVTPAGHMPNFTEEVNGAITHVCFDIPDGIGPGQAFQLSFMFEVPADVGCGEQDLGVNVSSTVMNANCMAQGIVCDVQVLNSVNPTIQVDYNPPVEVSDQVLTVGCGNGDGTVPICYDIELANNSVDYDDFIKIKLIRDLNQNGILENFDPAIDSISVNVMVLAGDTTNVLGCFNVDESIACPVFLMVMQETNCICDAQDFFYDSIEPEASDELGLSIAVCPGEPLKVGYCADLEYSVSPSNGAVIETSAAGDSLCITLEPGFGLTSPVVLKVSSQTGGCMMFDFETEIFSLGDFEFGPYEAETACNVGCINLDLDLPTEYRDIVTVLWEPATYLDDPTSQTPIACDVLMDITYTVTVNFMENGQMCEFTAEVPIIVEEQQTNPLFEQVILCSESTSTVVGPAGFSNYNWYEVTPTGDLPVQSGTSDSFIVPKAGVYYLEYYNITDACKTLSAPFDAIACPTLIKSFVSAIPTANENEYTVCYEIAVDNNSDLDTEYDLYDRPDFDDDITIISASYTSSVGPSGTLSVPAPASPGWLLGNDVQLVGLGGHTYDVCIVVQIDLADGVTGDDSYTACGANGGGGPAIGEGLFNVAGLDVDEDGTPDATDDACGELPFYTLEKTISSVTQTGAYDFTIVYSIVVCNDGGGFGTYDLNDLPNFDSDIIINSAEFTTDAFNHPSNPGPTALAGSGPWDLADLQNIEPTECHAYIVTVDVTMNLEDEATPGDGDYTACGDGGITPGQPGEGLYNEAQLDTNGDGMPNQTDDDCGDLPSITHDKVLTSITQTAARSWEVKYTITVDNNGGAAGEYDLEDEIAFDDDIVVTCVRYTSDAPANANNPGPTSSADLVGPWMIADDQNIDPEVTHTYCVIICVDMDLNSAGTPGDGDYDACGDGGATDGEPGEGLYNQSNMDLDNDGTPEETEEACGDLPNVYHEKNVVSFVPMANGNNMVTYEICVNNNGGADGTYDLYDEPQFDDDIEIIAATYSCDVGGAGSTLALPVPTGGWLLLDDQDISPSNEHCCTIEIEVDIDTAPGSGGDNTLSECGQANGGDPSPGEALYNESSLDLNNDGTPDEMDEACEDVFMLSHEKTIAGVTQTGHNSWCVTYNVTVENSGMEAGFYDLSDLPQFDTDITITSASYSSTIHPNTTLPTAPPAGGWVLGNDESIGSNVTHIYVLEVCVEIDLEDGVTGDDTYTECGAGGGADGAPGEGLYNESYLDTNNDGTNDETDEVCADLPFLTLEKEAISVTQTGARDFDVVYQITVCNIGGAVGEYNLLDTPCFDDDVVINGANYVSDATANAANPGPLNLAGAGPWTMASDQAITEGTCQVYDLTVNVTMDLTDPLTPGDATYTDCSAGDPADPSSRGGLYNKSTVDTNDDGQPDLQDEACQDLPHVTHEKDLTSITQTGANSWDVKYTITVTNDGGAAGAYDLNDDTTYDDDIIITCANYTSDAAGNAGAAGSVDLGIIDPWNLADDQAIAAGGVHVYCLIVCVDMDLNSPTTSGDGNYTECGAGGAGADGQPGEGLYNQSTLDVNNDGTPDEEDEACGDLPHLFHEKSVSSFAPMANGNHMVVYEICVTNDGGADGMYDLYDYPQFDDDIEIIAVEYTCDVSGTGTLALPVMGPNGWLLEDDVTIPAGETFCCTLDIEVNIDVAPGSGGDNIVTECGTAIPGDPSPGEALYNESSLDTNNDGTPDEMDEACEDVFNIAHEKSIVGVTETGHNAWCVTYQIVVENRGNESGFYDLTDIPQFDNDITITSATYSSTVHPSVNLSVPAPAAGWVLGNDEAIGSGVSHIYTLEVCVEIDLEDGVVGDDTYTECGASGGTIGAPGEGLYNESQLDTNDDGIPDETDEVCADLPYLTLQKDVVSVTQTGARDFDVVYAITVCNIGGAIGDYDMSDQPCFDDDIVINSAAYTSDAVSNAGNPGPLGLAGTGPWMMAIDQDIAAADCQVYTLTVNVTMDLTDPMTPGDGIYTSCASGDPADPASTGGLYNKSTVDTDGDGTSDLQDEACEELPNIVIQKELTMMESIQTDGSFDVEYKITVTNLGGAAGDYDVYDFPQADNDVIFNSASYTSDAGQMGTLTVAPMPAAPGWLLGDDVNLSAGGVHCYTLTTNVSIDLLDGMSGDDVYTECGSGGDGSGQPGEGLFNEALLDVDNDGTIDDEDDECADISDLMMTKDLVNISTQNADLSYDVTYEICVSNFAGSVGTYDLYDLPQYDTDITINSASFTSDIPTSGTLPAIVPGGLGWLLADDQMVGSMETQCFTLFVNVSMDLLDPATPGDADYTACGEGTGGVSAPGQGLYNIASLDDNNDGLADEEDEACGDLPQLVLTKTHTSTIETSLNCYDVTYIVTVENIGGATGYYDLVDDPLFDTDFTITSAIYTTDAAGNPAGSLPVTSSVYELADDQPIDANKLDTYTVTVGVCLDLEDDGAVDGGDDIYEASCGTANGGDDSSVGEGLHNEATLDTNNDGTPEQEDEACDDVPYLILDKEQVSATEQADGTWTIVYTVVVENIGGAAGEYDVFDLPQFDNDIVILSAEYTSDAGPSNPALPITVPATGWALATDQAIPAFDADTYTVTVNVDYDFFDGTTGDDSYTACGDGGGDPGNAGEGLFNEALLDANNDGTIDIVDETCEDLMEWDLALSKIETSSGPYTWGDLVTFEIEVYNQGPMTVTDIDVIDYIPCGFTYLPVNDTDWTYDAATGNAVTEYAGPLAAGQTVVIPITLELTMCATPADAWTNVSEISDFSDEDGNPQDDTDSTPDDTEGNDAGGNPDGDSDDVVDGDGSGAPGDDDPTTDEDDSDPEFIEIFDLALTKTIANTGPYTYQSDITFDITVMNQGNEFADNIEVIDYFPSCFTLNDVAWMDNGNSTASVTLSVANGGLSTALAPGQSIVVPITLQVGACTSQVQINYAEISGATDEDGNPESDVDSTPDTTNGNDAGGEENTDSDDATDGDGTGNADDTDATTDEDDHDPEDVIVEVAIWDLALLKTLTLGQSNPVSVGDVVSFDIQITNQGTEVADNIQITDYMPTCMSLTDADWTNNMDGTASIDLSVANGGLPAGGLAPAQSVVVDIVFTVDACASGVITNWAEISDFTDEDGDQQDDVDSTPDNDENNDTFGGDDVITEDGNTGGDEDDHDPSDITIITPPADMFDLALTKSLAPGQSSNVTNGSTVTYLITVINQGNVEADNIEVIDYMSSCMSLADAAWTDNGDGTASIDLSVANGGLAMALQPAMSIQVPITVLLTACTAGDIVNYAEIEGATDEDGNPVTDEDSTPDNDPTNDAGGNPDGDTDDTSGGDGDGTPGDDDVMGDEDDHDPEVITVSDDNPIFDLALTKIVSPGQAVPVQNGDDVSFMIEVFNQGTIPADNIEVVDYMPSCMSLMDTDWIDNGNGTASITLSVANGGLPFPLQPATSTSVEITLMVDSCNDGVETNWAEISGATDGNGGPVTDEDSTPDDTNDDPFQTDNDTSGDGTDDEDDHDPADIPIGVPGPQTFDLALVKVLAPGQSSTVMPGDFVNYEVFVVNQGTIAADNIEITDYIPSCLTLADAAWTDNGDGTATIALSVANGGLTGPLLAGQSIGVDLIMQVGTTCNGMSVTNWAEISDATDNDGNPVTDEDSTPDDDQGNDAYDEDNQTDGDGTDDEDDHDPEEIFIMDELEDIFDLALTKTLPAGAPSTIPTNSLVTFEITVYNQGSVSADNIEVIDYLPSCAELSDAAWTDNGDGTASRTLSVANGDLSFPLPPGGTIMVPVTVDYSGCGTGSHTNYAEIEGATDDDGNPQDDVDSTPDDDPNNDGTPNDNNVDDPNDEDDHDPEEVIISPIVDPEFDLALTKTLSASQSANVSDGAVVVFDITVYNQGNVAADDIEVIDYLPACLDLLDPNWFYDPSNNTAVRVISIANGDMAAPLGPGQAITVPITVRVNGCPLGQTINFAEIEEATDGNGDPVTDIDSTPDDDPDNDGPYTDNDIDNTGDDEDDHDPEVINIFEEGDPNVPSDFDLALIKIVAPGQNNEVSQGDNITFRIQVTNQGDIPADNIDIIDYLPSCVTLADPDWTDNGDGTASITYSVANGLLSSPLPPGQSFNVDITTLIGDCAGGDHTNYAEITDATDGNGDPVDDVDSTPDDDPDNDTFGGDNDTDNSNGDEDDHDPEDFYVTPIFDLALTKTITSMGPYAYGDDVDFAITIYNQGNISATNIEITDYTPSGYVFNIADNTGWVENGDGTLTYIETSLLAPGAQVIVPLTLEVVPTNGANGDWTNYSEISDATDEDGNPQDDVDSQMDDFPDNDNDVQPGDDDDDEINENPADGGDEDDHDPAAIEVFDLAQTKTTTAEGPFTYGDQITYTITVYNQGNVPATNVVVNDFLPCGLVYLPVNDGSWTHDAATNVATTTLAGIINPGAFAVIDITVEIDECHTDSPNAWTNYTEIESATDDEGNPQDDTDSTPDDDPDNDGDPVDDATDDPNDEDDHDPEFIEVFDLALTKVLTTDGPYMYGQDLDFDVNVINQGNVDAFAVEVSDYVPVGYVFDSALNPTWIYDAATRIATTTIATVVAGTTETVSITLGLIETGSGGADYYNAAEISDADDDMDPDNEDPTDADSDPDNDPDNDNDVTPGDDNDDEIEEDPNDEGEDDEDDADPAGPSFFDLATIKQEVSVGPYRYGDVVTFEFTLVNQGTITAYNIDVTDHIPCGYIYLPSNDANGWSLGADGNATRTIAGPFVPAQVMTYTIDVELQQCIDMDESSFTNVTEITDAEDEDGNPGEDIDSDPDGDPDNDGDPTDDSIDDPNDEDDHDPEEIVIYDLALIKQIVTPQPYAYGDLLEFKITVCNQGNQTVQNINVIDYLPAGYSFDPADQTTPWTVVGAGPDVEYTIAGPLLEDTCIELSIFLTLVESSGGVGNYTNISEITDFEDENGDPQVDADSDPDNDPDNDGDPTDDSLDDPNDEDDHDPEVIEVIDIATKKVEISTGPYKYGDQLNFSHWIYNQGNVGLTNIVLNDFIPCGYDYDTNNDPVWSYDAVSNIATTNVTDLIAAGDSLEVKLSLILKICYEPDAWKNISEIESFDDENGDDRTDDDIDSDADNDPDNDGDVVDDEIDNGGGDEDDNDPEEPEIFDLALIKTIDNIGPYTPGQIAMYDITVYNQGNVPAYDIDVVDYINVGYIFNASDNPGWNQAGSNAHYTIAGPLNPGQEVTITINLEVQVPPGADLSSWYNEAEINEAKDEEGNAREDADSTPDDDAFNDNDLVDGLDDDNIFDEDDLNDNEIDNNNGDEDDNDAAEILVTGEIGDYVWKDLNGDGIQDPGEPGIEGVTVRLFDCDGNFIRELTTDENGYYIFDLLLPGAYQLQFDITDLPPGCAFTLPNQGDDAADSDTDLNGNTPCIDLEAGERNHTIDAGVLPLAKLGDTVWEDCNGDGILNNGEQGIAGIKVEVYDADNVLVKITSTGADGKYIVDGLYPGDYYVKFVIGDYEFTMPGIGGDGTVDSDVDDSNGAGTTALVTLSAGECDISSFDAGLYKCVRIGELVWLDYNENDVWDSFENGINGLKVELYKFIDGSWEYYDYTYSGHKPGTPSDDGYFKFCVAPGRYYLKFLNPPASLVPAVSNFGINESVDSDVTGAFGPGTTSEIVLACGQERCDIGAGYYKMGSIGDNVWMDTNNNGMRETSEQGLKDVIVRAYDNTGSLLGEATTDSNGDYMIDYLGKNSYYLEFDLPNGFALTTPNMGSDDTMDSDVDGSNGPMTTDYYTINPGEHVPNVDAGVVFGVLSVEWLDIRAENNDSHHTVTWDVSKESNVSHYEVERSLNGLDDFEVIGKILSEEDSPEQRTYSYDDYDVAESGIYYYRINQVELDGAIDYSKVVSVDREAVLLTDNIASIYPNPVVNELTLELVITKPVEDLTVNIFDAQGRIVRKNAIMDIDVSTGAKTYRIDVRDFSEGVYSMKIMLDRKEIVKKLIVVE